MLKRFNEYDNFIFDFDGTLADTADEVLSCIEKAFNKCNVSFDKERLNPSVMGPSLAEIAKIVKPDLTDENIVNNIVSEYRKIYDYDEKDITKLYDGIRDCLLYLKQNNKKIFIATNKPKIPTLRLVKSLNIDFFDDVYMVDKYDDKKLTKQQMIEEIVSKYNLPKEKTIMVGDCLSDIEAAKKAGVLSLVALWGYGADKKALKDKADFCLEKITND
ncbi:HAD family hydrolase [Candidatus Ruminimicrobiellum ovillum]|uniref:HAD family hydrolase n=1 Tax=Candidatus Ruminimicrobiellum ovillum TaxID=1947927 RepID=UPI00355A9BCD